MTKCLVCCLFGFLVEGQLSLHTVASKIFARWCIVIGIFVTLTIYAVVPVTSPANPYLLQQC